MIPLAAVVVAVVKLVVAFSRPRGESCVCDVCVGVPVSLHVSSADPVQELHAN